MLTMHVLYRLSYLGPRTKTRHITAGCGRVQPKTSGAGADNYLIEGVIETPLFEFFNSTLAGLT